MEERTNQTVMRLLRQAGRRAPHGSHVWEAWRSYRDRGTLSQSQTLELAAARSGAPVANCSCPYCLTRLEEFPWMRDSPLEPGQRTGIACVPRRLLGMLLLLPALLLWPLGVAVYRLVALSVRPNLMRVAGGGGVGEALFGAYRFCFDQDFRTAHLVIAGLTGLAWLSAWRVL